MQATKAKEEGNTHFKATAPKGTYCQGVGPLQPILFLSVQMRDGKSTECNERIFQVGSWEQAASSYLSALELLGFEACARLRVWFSDSVCRTSEPACAPLRGTCRSAS